MDRGFKDIMAENAHAFMKNLALKRPVVDDEVCMLKGVPLRADTGRERRVEIVVGVDFLQN